MTIFLHSKLKRPLKEPSRDSAKEASKVSSLLGLVLTEALVAMASLTTAVIISSTIINNAISSIAISRDYLIAQNLTTEAIEAVKIIKDSNRLIAPSKKFCWRVLDPAQLAAKIQQGVNIVNLSDCGPYANTFFNYVPLFQNNYWKLLSKGPTVLNLTPGNDPNVYQIHIKEEADFKQFINDTALNNESKFYRSVKFSTINAQEAIFEVKVQWKEGVKVRTINRKIKLNNYF